MIKLITFDLDDTLWAVDEVMIKATTYLSTWLKEHYPEIAENFPNDKMFLLSQELLKSKPEMKGDFTWIRKETIRHAALRSGITDNKAAKLSETAFEIFLAERNKVTLFTDTITVLETLNKNYKIIGISNGNADLEVIGINHLFTHHFKAGNGLAAKPNAEMFHLAFKAANVTAKETIHIGDNFECDVKAANTLGCKTIYADVLNRQDKNSIDLADGRFSTLAELPALIESLNT